MEDDGIKIVIANGWRYYSIEMMEKYVKQKRITETTKLPLILLLNALFEIDIIVVDKATKRRLVADVSYIMLRNDPIHDNVKKAIRAATPASSPIICINDDNAEPYVVRGAYTVANSYMKRRRFVDCYMIGLDLLPIFEVSERVAKSTKLLSQQVSKKRF